MTKIFEQIRHIIPKGIRPSDFVRRRVVRQTKGRVASGPFEGMKFVAQGVCGAVIPKLLGVYEKELHPSIEKIEHVEIAHIINVGGAEGYYVVGLLKLLKEATATVFELQVKGQNLIREVAKRNGVVERISILGKCNIESLRSAMGKDGNSLIVCDVEGFERTLLDPSNINGLKGSYILVEVHDHLCPGVGQQLIRRFESSHSITKVHQESRKKEDYPLRDPIIKALPFIVNRYALNEFRSPEIYWLWMTPIVEG